MDWMSLCMPFSDTSLENYNPVVSLTSTEHFTIFQLIVLVLKIK